MPNKTNKELTEMPDFNQPTSMPETKTNPDPSTATLAVIEKAANTHKEIVEAQLQVILTRMDGMDKATIVLSETYNRTPTLLQTAISNFTDLMGQRFDGVFEKFSEVNKQFDSIEAQRLEQKADAKTGLDAALQAQKESAAKQDESNQKAIGKSESATNENIKKLEDLFTSKTNGLSDKIDDTKILVANAVTKVEHAAVLASISSLSTRMDNRDGQSQGKDNSWKFLIGGVGLVLALLQGVTIILSFNK